MGQCYSVVCKLKFNTKDTVRKATADYMNDVECNWHKTKEEIESLELEELLKMFLYIEDFEYKSFMNGSFEISFNTDFNQSYSWESLIYDWFNSISNTLRNGSFLKVYPDSDYTRFVIQNNECVCTH